MKPASIFSRALAFIVDFVLMLVFSLTIDAGIVTQIVKTTDSYKTIDNEYFVLVEQYSEKQDQFNIYIYEGENRIQNPNLSEEDKNIFLNNEEVIEIRNKIIKNGEIKRNYFLLEAAISLLIGSFVYYLIIPFLIKGRFTIGKAVFHISIINHEDELLKGFGYLKYSLVEYVFAIILGIATLFIINIISLIVVDRSINKQSISNLISNTYSVVDPIYLEKRGENE